MKKIWGVVAGYLRVMDKWLLLLWLGATGVSCLFLYGLALADLTSISRMHMQLAASGTGLFFAIAISLVDYNLLLKFWKLYLPACLLLIGLTFTSLGIVRGGDRAWLPMPLIGGTIQPSEFLKISFITTLSLHIAKVKEDINRPVQMLLLLLHGGIHILLIQLQDSGTALVFLFIFVIMLFFAGVGWRYIAAALGSLVVVLPLLWFKIMTVDHKMRILTLRDPELDLAYSYQQTQGTLALGIGGVEGTGLFSGTRHVRVPEIYNDFIFTFVGETTGFMGCLGVIVLLTLICCKILYNSSKAVDDTGRLLCVGVFAMLLTQMAINLGMCLSLLPVIGVTLPLLSAGGTSVLSLYLGLGLVLSVYTHSTTGLFHQR